MLNFDKAKMIAKALKLKKAVEAEMVEMEENGIKIKVSGSAQVKNLWINGVENRALVDLINKALKKAQESAAKKMQEMGGLDGLF